jgi:AraC-like DNA-binding protein
MMTVPITAPLIPLAFADIFRVGISTVENLIVPRRLALFAGAEPALAAYGQVCGMVFPVLMFPASILYSLAELSPRKKEENDVIARVARITGESFSDPALSLSTVAAEIGYHDKYISALFKRQKGITYTQYLRELRIRHAVFLIEQGVVSVKNIAILSGFGDALYFSKVFKEAKGISPKEMIRRVAKGNS